MKRMKGSSRDIMDPIEILMMQTFLVNRTIRHNDVIRAFTKLAKRAGIEGGRYVEPIPAKEAVKYTVNVQRGAGAQGARDSASIPTTPRCWLSSVGDMFGGEDPLIGSFFRMEQAKKRGEPIIFYKEGGQLKAARFMAGKEGHALYETLTAAPAPITDLWVDLIRGAAVIKRSGIVTNPTFALSNYIRDQIAVRCSNRLHAHRFRVARHRIRSPPGRGGAALQIRGRRRRRRLDRPRRQGGGARDRRAGQEGLRGQPADLAQGAARTLKHHRGRHPQQRVRQGVRGEEEAGPLRLRGDVRGRAPGAGPPRFLAGTARIRWDPPVAAVHQRAHARPRQSLPHHRRADHHQAARRPGVRPRSRASSRMRWRPP